jgi:hypothetical protein
MGEWSLSFVQLSPDRRPELPLGVQTRLPAIAALIVKVDK